MKDDIYYINRCEELGKSAAQKGNPPVGSVIVKDDQILVKQKKQLKQKTM